MKYMALLAVAFLAACSQSGTSSLQQLATGSLSDTQLSTTWTGGPFVVANVSAQAGPPICNAALPCDDFTLVVSTPAGYGDAHQLDVSIAWPLANADFDLYVLDSSGNVIADSATSGDPEKTLVPATSGTYTVRVIPFNPLGQSYTGTATLEDKPVPPSPSTEPAPTYAAYAAPDSLSGAHNAGEPSIGTNFNTGATLYEAGLSTFRVAFDDSTTTATWTDVSASPPACTSAVSLDPILYTDHATGRTFESQLAGINSLTCYTDNDGVTWTPTAETGINSGVDHQTIGGGAFSSGGLGALGLYPHVFYYCSQDVAMAQCATSRDGGETFGPAVPMYSIYECGGIHGHVKVAPDGTAYVPNKSCGANQAVVVSEDNGVTWSVRQNPASTAGDTDPSVGIGAGGTIYLGYQNADGTAHAAVSHDKGKTWVNDQDVGITLGIKNVVFPAVVAGDDDRAAFAFIGTTTAGNYQDAANFKGEWHLYIATTYDGGATWVTADATPNDPVQRGSICTAGTTCGTDRNLLDFIDVTLDGQGRVLVGFADGCTGTCVAPGGAQNFDALSSIARETGGRRLLAAYDPFPNLTVSAPTVTLNGNKTASLSSKVSNTGNQPASNVVVRFYDNGAKIAETMVASLAVGASTTVLATWSTKKTHGTRTVSVTVDPDNAIREVSETDNSASTSVTLP